MSSYYNNGPRIFTPAALKTSKTFMPLESFGTSPGVESPPEAINTCHRSRGQYLQHTHPRTYALLRKHEADKVSKDTIPSPKP